MEESLKLAYFVEETPGPGFLPFWVSAGIIVSGLVLVARSFRLRLSVDDEEHWPDGMGWGRIAIVMVALGAAILLLDLLGFLLMAAIFVAAVAFGLGMRSLRVLIPVPILSALLLNQVFAVWLRVPLPKGILSLFS